MFCIQVFNDFLDKLETELEKRSIIYNNLICLDKKDSIIELLTSVIFYKNDTPKKLHSECSK